jgi:phosphate transport system permease protein
VKNREFVIEALIRAAGFSAIFFVVLIFLFLMREGAPAFWETSLGNFFGERWYPNEGLFGTLPLILGSLLVTLGAVVIALPLGLATAVFIRELAPDWLREILKPLVEVLAGIPSVVLGFLGMVAVSPLVREWLNVPTGLTAFTGSLMLAYMSLPTIISVADDAIDAVPKAHRDGALASGRDPLADHLAGGAARSALGGDHRRDVGHWPGHRRNDGGDDGHRQCSAHSSGVECPLFSGADHDCHHCGRDG